MKAVKKIFQLLESEPELYKIRHTLINRMYQAMIFFIIPALALSLSRIIYTGWKWIYLSHILISVITIVFYLYKKSLSIELKTHVICVLFLFISFFGLFSFGITSAYYVCLITVVISTLIFGIRIGYMYLSIASFGLIAIAILNLTHLIETGIDYNMYNRNVITWILMLYIIIWVMIILIFGIGLFYNYFQQNIKQLINKTHEQELAQKVIQENENKYRLLFENAGDVILSLNLETIIIDANDFATRLLGYSKEELIGMKISNLVPKEELTNQAKYLTEVNQQKGTLSYRTLVKKDGTLVPTQINNRLIEGIGYIAIIRDITVSKKAELAILESEEKYHSLVEHASDAIFLLDENTNFSHLNTAMCKLLGYEREELLQMKLADVYLAAELERKPLSVEYLRQNKKLLIERKWKRKDGIEIDVEINTKVIEGKGYLNIARDITERKKTEAAIEASREKLQKSEERLSLALKATADAIWEWNYVTGKTFYSTRWYEMLGYEDQEFDMDFETWKSLCHPEDFQKTVDLIASVINNPRSLGYNAEFRMRNKNGDWIWILGRGNVVKRDENGAPVQLSGTNTDITFRKNAEVELKKTVSELNDRNNELLQFNYIVSHNLRAPIASIKGLVSIMDLPNFDTDERQRLLNQIHNSVSKMDDLLKDLNIILASRSALNTKKEKTNINEILKGIFDIFHEQIIDSKAEIITNINSDSEEIFTIKAYMESILYNLIHNALKYKSSARPLKISIIGSRNQDSIIIKVIDNGIGINLKKYSENIFGLYTRFNVDLPGKGLGLHMTKTQVEALGGKIVVESEIDKGTTFKIVFPVA
ncbi:MAG: PAS domain S-box protein [Bacteroidota bacterium]|nr:PAS domain S-box protein [Bacteroidota bacterium]